MPAAISRPMAWTAPSENEFGAGVGFAAVPPGVRVLKVENWGSGGIRWYSASGSSTRRRRLRSGCAEPRRSPSRDSRPACGGWWPSPYYRHRHQWRWLRVARAGPEAGWRCCSITEQVGGWRVTAGRCGHWNKRRGKLDCLELGHVSAPSCVKPSRLCHFKDSLSRALTGPVTQPPCQVARFC